ncbi:MAG: FAD-binding oxidoreductase [Geminicoccaceae bacterium]|nr:FAD-binding oxidoreductase [Geminicoccaceae bacterium]
MGGYSVAVVGGGIVGVATALTLQLDGHAVRLFDPREPGTATSYGNAGGIVTNGFIPNATPGLWRRLPSMLLDRDGPFSLRMRHLPRALPWFSAFLACSSGKRSTAIARDMAPLTTAALDAHRVLVEKANAQSHVRPVGWLKIYRDPATVAGMTFDLGLLDHFGMRYDILGEDELRQLEPGLSRDFKAALFYPDSAFVSTPLDLTRAYLRCFLDHGGSWIRENVIDFDDGPAGPQQLVTDSGRHGFDRLVISAGAWSARLTRKLGVPVPLDCERGYHLRLAWDGETPKLGRPVVVGGPQFVLCPMANGLRLTGGVEFAGIDAAPDFARIRRMVPIARKVLPGLGDEILEEWMGHRPSLPDSKPVIGRSTIHERVWFAFGHGHTGLTLSAITGRMVADGIAGRQAGIPLEPFRPDRFRGPLAPAA